jgi:hypothetical protein
MPTFDELLDQFSTAEAMPAEEIPVESDFDIRVNRWMQWEPTTEGVRALDKQLNNLSRPAQKLIAETSARQRMEGHGSVYRNVLPVYDAIPATLESMLARGANAILPEGMSPFSRDAADYYQWYMAEQERVAQQSENAGGNAVLPPWVSRNARGTAKSLPMSALGGKFGGKAGAAAAGAAIEANSALTEGRDAGLTGPKLYAYAATQGAAEGAIPFIPGLGGLEDRLGKGNATAVKRGVWEAVKAYGSDIAQENLTSLAQKVSDRLYGVDPAALDSPEKWGQMAFDTTAQSIMGSAAVDAANRGGQAVSDYQRGQRLTDLRQQRSDQQAASVFNDAAWSTGDVAKSTVEQLLAAGKTPDQIRELATSPTSNAFEANGLGSRKERTMPTAEARRAFGANALKYLESKYGNGQTEAAAEVPAANREAAEYPEQAGTGQPAANPNDPVAAGEQPVVSTAGYDLFGAPVAEQPPPARTTPAPISGRQIREAIPEKLRPWLDAVPARVLRETPVSKVIVHSSDNRSASDDIGDVHYDHRSTRLHVVDADSDLAPEELQNELIASWAWENLTDDDYFEFMRAAGRTPPPDSEGIRGGVGGGLSNVDTVAHHAILWMKKKFPQEHPVSQFFEKLFADQQRDLLGQSLENKPAAPPQAEPIPQPQQETLFDKRGALGQMNAFDDVGVPDEMVVQNPPDIAPTPDATPAPEPAPDNPIGRTKDFRKIAEYQAKNWDMTPEDYAGFARQVWDEQTSYLGEIDAARKHAQQATKLYPRDIKRIEDKGLDHSSVKGFDVIASEVANNYPALGWQHLAGESSSELEGRLWELLKQGQQKAPPKWSPEYHQKVDEYLNDLQHGAPTFNPGEFEESPDYAFRMPQSPTQQGGTDQLVQMSPGAPEVAMKMDAEADPGVSAQGIVATLAKLFDVPIRSGRVALRKALGIYKKREEIVRTQGQSSADLAVLTHEVAHHLDFTTDVRQNKALTPAMRQELRNLDYDPQKKRAFEGFAEFVRLYMTMPPQTAQQAAPKFFDHFTLDWLPKHPDFARKVEQARGLVEQYRTQGAAARVDSAISETGQPPADYRPWRERFGEWVTTQAHRIYSQWKDKGHAINLFDEAAKKAGYKLPESGSYAGELYQAFDQSGISHAERALEDGVHLVTSSGKKIGAGMREILAPITPAEYPDFRRFLVARHALEVYEKKPGMNPGVAREDAKHIVDAVAADPAKLERFTTAANGVTGFNQNLLDMLVDAGVITPQSADAMKKQWETYIPLFRAVEKGGGRFGGSLIDLPDPVRRRHGSGRQILDPIESTMQQAIAFYNTALKKQVQLQIVDEASKSRGLGAWVEKVAPNQKVTRVSMEDIWQKVAERFNELGIADIVLDKESLMELGPEFANDYINIYRPDYSPSPQERVIRVVENGQPSLYQLDPELYDALDTMSPVQVLPFLRIFDSVAHGLASITRLGATGLKTTFSAANLPRDWLTYQIQSEHGRSGWSMTDPLKWIGLYTASKTMSLVGKAEDPVVRLWEEMGGQLATTLGQDRKALRRYRDNLVANSTKSRMRELLVHPINTLRDIVGVSEVGPRLAEFANVLTENGYVRQKGKVGVMVDGQFTEQRPPRDVLVTAINAANDVTVNFKRMGSVGRLVNRYVPFFNAALEGNAKRGRVLKAMGTGGQNWKRKAIGMASLAAASLVYALARVRDDDYREQDDWLKFSYWTFTNEGTPIIRIPKPYEFSFIPNFVEAAVASVYEGESTPAKAAAKTELERLVPPIAPTVAKPAVESFANYDTFRQKPIDNPTLQRLKPEDRFTPQTTELMKWIGDFVNMSPNQLEHLAQGYTGGLYRNTYGLGERAATGKLSGDDIPVAGAFAVKRDYAKSVDEFYERKAELDQAAQSAKGTDEAGKAKAEARRFDAFADVMADLRKQLEGKTGREERFEIEKQIIGLARKALRKPALERYPAPVSQ